MATRRIAALRKVISSGQQVGNSLLSDAKASWRGLAWLGGARQGRAGPGITTQGNRSTRRLGNRAPAGAKASGLGRAWPGEAWRGMARHHNARASQRQASGNGRFPMRKHRSFAWHGWAGLGGARRGKAGLGLAGQGEARHGITTQGLLRSGKPAMVFRCAWHHRSVHGTSRLVPAWLDWSRHGLTSSGIARQLFY